MNLLGKFSIRTRLILILVIFMVVFIAFGIYTMMQMDTFVKTISQMYEDPMTVSNATNRAIVDIVKLQRGIRDIILSKGNEEMYTREKEIEAIAQRVLESLNEIRQYTNAEINLVLEEQVRGLFFRWRRNHAEAIELTLDNRIDEATKIILNQGASFAEDMEEILRGIEANSRYSAHGFVSKGIKLEKQIIFTLVTSMIIIGIFLIAFFTVTISSVVKPIAILKNTMDRSIATGKLDRVTLTGDNEITDISRYYNLLVDKLKNEFWVKDNQNLLNYEMSGLDSLENVTQRAISFLAREVDAIKGSLYLYDKESKSLVLASSYAYAESDLVNGRYMLGQGIVGQVAVEGKPILLTNIIKDQEYIDTEIFRGLPLNIYSFPLTMEEDLYGVIELASFETFDEIKIELLKECSDIISINIFTQIQNQKIRELLEISEKARLEAKNMADKLQKTNSLLEEQQVTLHQQSAELQQTNAELEENQQLLQHQREELYQINSQLEEQQQAIEEQSVLLSMKNQELEISREELLQRAEELSIANRYKSEFLANMSHELRTPLNSIILLSKLIMKNKNMKMDQDELEKIGIIHSSGQELLRLINDILDLSKIEAGKTTVDKSDFFSYRLVRDLKDLFYDVAEEKNIKFITEDEINGRLFGDYPKISQILRNLISNSIKFTESGSVTLRISSGDLKEGNVLYSVIDTGIGVSKENITRIFEEFQQGDGSISRRFGGTGLGLSICKKLAKLMGGEIRVVSEEGRGSIFSLYLPGGIPLINHYNKDLGENCFQEVAVTTDSHIYNGDTDKTILIIEDNEELAHTIKRVNENMGFNTLIAKAGREGLELCKQYKVIGIMLDLLLPDMNGMEVLRALKRSKFAKNIPVHIISAMDKNNGPQQMGAVGYKQKPLEEQDIIDIISKLVNLSNKRVKNLLIVESNEEQREKIRKLIGDRDIDIRVADTEKRAKDEIDRREYDAIILNLDLIEGTGLNVCKHLHHRKLEIPTIIYTGQELTPEQEKELKFYKESIIIKTATSGQGLMDEVTLFLHRVKTNRQNYVISKANMEKGLGLDGKKVLIVDDDPRNIFVLASALEEHGVEILEAENGRVAIDKLRDNWVDLILMDVMMPEMDGIETIKTIKGDEALASTPIIAVTAKSLKEDKEKCIAAGANDYISKPIDYDVLVTLVKAWIGK